MESAEILEGTIKWFNNQKGYGFIAQESGVDLFVHASQVNGDPEKGNNVQFEIGESRKGPCAINAKIV
jgi:cold shock protein